MGNETWQIEILQKLSHWARRPSTPRRQIAGDLLKLIARKAVICDVKHILM
jgi:hypothetical protein